MYERSAIVLENYFSRIFGLNKRIPKSNTRRRKCYTKI